MNLTCEGRSNISAVYISTMNFPFTNKVPMSNPVYDRLCEEVYKSYPNACVLFVREVSNHVLDDKYERYKEALGEKVQEGRGWHGTRAENISNISTDGFDPSKNKCAAYGLGTYIATMASYSSTYMREDQHDISYMFHCKFAYLNKIQSRMYCQRQIPGADKGCIGVDSVESPSIFAIPQADAVIPEYVIAFHKNAK